MELKWVLQDDEISDQSNVFSDRLKIPRKLARILVNRGIDNDDKALKYFKSDLNDLYDPFVFPDMQKAIDRIIRAKSSLVV